MYFLKSKKRKEKINSPIEKKKNYKYTRIYLFWLNNGSIKAFLFFILVYCKIFLREKPVPESEMHNTTNDDSSIKKMKKQLDL